MKDLFFRLLKLRRPTSTNRLPLWLLILLFSLEVDLLFCSSSKTSYSLMGICYNFLFLVCDELFFLTQQLPLKMT